jgi:hypothetical protein
MADASRIARISTVFACSAAELWAELGRPQSLQYVSAPLLRFSPERPGELDTPWATGKTYELRLYFLGFVPLGKHRIRLVRLDRKRNLIESRESGTLARVWNHTIRFNPVTGGRIEYTDEIEIEAGALTLFVLAFAHVFYRHRQRRWKTLLARARSVKE